MGTAIRQNDIDFTKVGFRYMIDFDKQESTLSGTVPVELRPPHILRVGSK